MVLRATMWPVDVIKQQKLHLITWTDLVFREPFPKPPGKVATTGAKRCGGSSVDVSKLCPNSSDTRLEKMIQKAKSLPLSKGSIQEDVAKEEQDSSPSQLHTVWPTSDSADPQKTAVRKILVDLRPILENVMEPIPCKKQNQEGIDSFTARCRSSRSGHCIQKDVAEGGQDSSPPQFHTVRPPSAPKNTTKPEKRADRKILVDLQPILEKVTEPICSRKEDPVETDLLIDECLSSRSGESRSEDLTTGWGESSTEASAVSSRDVSSGDASSSTHQDFSLPPIVDLNKAFSLETINIPQGSKLQMKDSTKFWENHVAPSPVPESKIKTPVSFPKISPLFQKTKLETNWASEGEGTNPEALSPDFQLPTRVFLQKLQETTTTKDHQLITQALRQYRKELMADYPDLDNGDKSNHFPVLSKSNLWQRRITEGRPQELNSSPDVARKKQHRVICYIGRVQSKADQEEMKQTRLFGSSKPRQVHCLLAKAVAVPIRQAHLNINTKVAVK